MRIKATIAYDGSKYCGWQKQDHAHTVQAEVERIVSTLNKEKTEVVSSGRTDKGVHALKQVVHFDLKYEIPITRLFRAFNDLCPSDIVLEDIQYVNSDFHARFSAKSKHYRYIINTGSYKLFEYDYIYQLNRALDIDKMRECAKLFVGKHNFAAFNATPFEEKENQVRNVYDLKISEEDDKVMIDIHADSYLRYMVRMIVGTLVEVGLNKRSICSVSELLKSETKSDFVYNICPNGLYLVEVFY